VSETDRPVQTDADRFAMAIAMANSLKDEFNRHRQRRCRHLVIVRECEDHECVARAVLDS
jgi:hypothetical protein